MANTDHSTTTTSTSSDPQQPDLLKDMNFFSTEICSRLDSRTCLRLCATNTSVKEGITDALIKALHRDLFHSNRLSPDVVLDQLKCLLAVTESDLPGQYDQLCRLYDRIRASPKLQQREYAVVWDAVLARSEKLRRITSARADEFYVSANLIDRLAAFRLQIPSSWAGMTLSESYLASHVVEEGRPELLYDYDFLVFLLEENVSFDLVDIFLLVVVPTEALCRVLPLYRSFWPESESADRYNWLFLQRLAYAKPENRAVFWQIPAVREHFQDRIPELIRELGAPVLNLIGLGIVFRSQYPFCKELVRDLYCAYPVDALKCLMEHFLLHPFRTLIKSGIQEAVRIDPAVHDAVALSYPDLIPE